MSEREVGISKFTKIINSKEICSRIKDKAISELEEIADRPKCNFRPDASNLMDAFRWSFAPSGKLFWARINLACNTNKNKTVTPSRTTQSDIKHAVLELFKDDDNKLRIITCSKPASQEDQATKDMYTENYFIMRNAVLDLMVSAIDSNKALEHFTERPEAFDEYVHSMYSKVAFASDCVMSMVGM